MKRSSPGFPASFPLPETIFIDAGEAGGIVNALHQAREILFRLGAGGQGRSGAERRRHPGARRRMEAMYGGI